MLLAVPAPAAGPDPDACRTARDRDLRILANAAISIAAELDADAAIEGAPEYELEKARDAQMAEIDRARREVERQYRDCVARRRRD